MCYQPQHKGKSAREWCRLAYFLTPLHFSATLWCERFSSFTRHSAKGPIHRLFRGHVQPSLMRTHHYRPGCKQILTLMIQRIISCIKPCFFAKRQKQQAKFAFCDLIFLILQQRITGLRRAFKKVWILVGKCEIWALDVIAVNRNPFSFG